MTQLSVLLLNFVQWFGEVRNNGTSPACYIEIIHAPASNLETVKAGASWAWKALAYQGAKPASYLVFADYLQP